GVGVGVEVSVAVGVGVGVEVSVAVEVGVGVGVAVAVKVDVGVEVTMVVEVEVGIAAVALKSLKSVSNMYPAAAYTRLNSINTEMILLISLGIIFSEPYFNEKKE
ncbi:MAG: hypothetical protein J5U19_12290, partial [Candidatus Methanoperedens sp.]|nr:hypothetical protein [Candidatus Methanoperedens sp.]